jgi:hypothetical protein
MRQIPPPDFIFGKQGITQEDKNYQGSRFSGIKAAIFANPYQKVWVILTNLHFSTTEPPIGAFTEAHCPAVNRLNSGLLLSEL